MLTKTNPYISAGTKSDGEDNLGIDTFAASYILLCGELVPDVTKSLGGSLIRLIETRNSKTQQKSSHNILPLLDIIPFDVTVL